MIYRLLLVSLILFTALMAAAMYQIRLVETRLPASYIPLPPAKTNIATTYFQAGAPASPDDQGITNESSAWYHNWAQHMCGVDTDGSREVVKLGCDNLYYAALPCLDIDSDGRVVNANIRYAPTDWRFTPGDKSIFKNRWIRVQHADKVVYVQWEDVGPLYTDDCDYVFGSSRPRQERTKAVASALDISPAAFKTLTNGDLSVGIIQTNWQFVDASAVPDGPWRRNITTAQPDWQG